MLAGLLRIASATLKLRLMYVRHLVRDAIRALLVFVTRSTDRQPWLNLGIRLCIQRYASSAP
jgi:hypothetical protein